MAGYKETPRQKMIAMMYLVLTALLALNVSKQILDAFLVVNESMITTNEIVYSKIETVYDQFSNQYTLPTQNEISLMGEMCAECFLPAMTGRYPFAGASTSPEAMRSMMAISDRQSCIRWCSSPDMCRS